MHNDQQTPLITILGPTASGKTKLAVTLAQQFNGEIISADSRQVYRHMDIGTGKDLCEYGDIPYHLIDIIDPQCEFNLFEFAQAFCQSYLQTQKNDSTPFLVGGTGMYLDAVLNRYDLTMAKTDEKSRLLLEKKTDEGLISLLSELKPIQHNTTDHSDRARLIQAIEIANAERASNVSVEWPQFYPITIGIKVPREEIKQRITTRLKSRFDEGMIEEVEQLLHKGVTWEKLHFFGLEYRFIALYLKTELSYNDMFQKLNSAIHYFSKQQEKWFKRMERKGLDICWLDYDDNLTQQASEHITKALNHTSTLCK